MAPGLGGGGADLGGGGTAVAAPPGGMGSDGSGEPPDPADVDKWLKWTAYKSKVAGLDSLSAELHSSLPPRSPSVEEVLRESAEFEAAGRRGDPMPNPRHRGPLFEIYHEARGGGDAAPGTPPEPDLTGDADPPEWLDASEHDRMRRALCMHASIMVSTLKRKK